VPASSRPSHQAAAAAGTALLIGLALAAGVAYCNAVASAQLAAQYPTSGGTYVYGRERLGEWWGFLAGWGFVVGKTASCAAMALTFASYAVPGSTWAQRLAAVLAVAVLTAANCHGITRTAGLARVLVAGSLLALLVVVGAILVSGGTDGSNLTGSSPHGVYGVLQSAGLLFFAFAGYARIATLGEEGARPGADDPPGDPARARHHGRDLRRCRPHRAARGRAGGARRHLHAARHRGEGGRRGMVGARRAHRGTVASLGALLALIAGIGRTSLAMARNGDLPRRLAAVDPVHRVPARAELAVGAVVCLLVSPPTSAAQSASRRSACSPTTRSRTPLRTPSRPSGAAGHAR
jgi:APA family basic amino acid/polyamine antiporter